MVKASSGQEEQEGRHDFDTAKGTGRGKKNTDPNIALVYEQLLTASLNQPTPFTAEELVLNAALLVTHWLLRHIRILVNSLDAVEDMAILWVIAVHLGILEKGKEAE